MKALVVTAVLCIACLATPAAAQRPAEPCPDAPLAGADTTERRPDVVISATARIRELRFEAPPRAGIELTGCPVFDSVRVERVNLPTPVQPGVTYRDVTVSLDAVGFLDVECLLAAPLAGAAGDSLRAALGRSLAGLCAPAADTAAARRR